MMDNKMKINQVKKEIQEIIRAGCCWVLSTSIQFIEAYFIPFRRKWQIESRRLTKLSKRKIFDIDTLLIYYLQYKIMLVNGFRKLKQTYNMLVKENLEIREFNNEI